MTRRLRLGVLSLLTALLATAGFAPDVVRADEQTRFDDDDSEGPLDVAAVRLRHRVFFQVSSHSKTRRRVTEIKLRLATYEKWDSELLTGRKNFIAFEFNFDDDAIRERCIVITHGEFEPRVELHRRCWTTKQEFVRVLSGHRPNGHSIVVAIDRHRLKRGLREFTWRAVTSYEDPEADRDDPCWAGTFPSPGPYGVCEDLTKARHHRFR
ncbi:MAG: hypothetical protein ABR505_00825 [Actinomycetota bacterium]